MEKWYLFYNLLVFLEISLILRTFAPPYSTLFWTFEKMSHSGKCYIRMFVVEYLLSNPLPRLWPNFPNNASRGTKASFTFRTIDSRYTQTTCLIRITSNAVATTRTVNWVFLPLHVMHKSNQLLSSTAAAAAAAQVWHSTSMERPSVAKARTHSQIQFRTSCCREPAWSFSVECPWLRKHLKQIPVRND